MNIKDDGQSKDSNISLILTLITMIYVTVMLVTIVMAYKLVSILGISIVASTLVLPIWLMIEGIIAEVYGYNITRKIIWTSILCEFTFILICFILIHLPSPTYWTHESSFLYVFNKLPRVFIGSCAGIIIGAFSNAYAISKWKVLLKGKLFWLRAIGASAIGELIFTIIVILSNYLGVFAFKHLLELMLASYIFKLIMTLLCALPAYWISNKIKKIGNIDIYDRNLNFNPFRINN